MLWACLRFPQLALDALRVDADAPSAAKPRAVIDGPQQRRHIVLADAAARRQGVHAGQALSAAQVLCPRLSILPRDEAAERQALESLAAWAYRFSAEVHLAAADAIFIEIGASLSLFGGWPALERRLRHELARFGFAYTLAAAPTATAAHVLATHSDGIAIPASGPLETALGIVPIAASGLTEKVIAALHGMGFRELRELFPLPRAELTRRIGEEALAHLDRMRGLAAETWLRWQPPARFERRIEFSYGVESNTALAFPLQRLIRELALFLIARDGGVLRFTLTLGHERGARTRVEVGLLAPQRDAASLFELARARLERIELAAPVHALGLRADDLPPLCPLHRDLFDDHRREQLDWPALVERLRARLGDDALQGLAEVADHRPGRAWRFVPALDRSISLREGRPVSTRRSSAKNATVPTVSTTATAAAKPRPFWLLRQPILLHGVPTRILAGPERIESGWWDGHDYRRDYYIVETRLGQRAWAYVEAGATSNWTLHGWFA
ncbi:MAG: DNA polymerase Y family protein [Dokdonella sp.]